MQSALENVLPDEFSALSCFERDERLKSLLRDAPPGCFYCQADELLGED